MTKSIYRYLLIVCWYFPTSFILGQDAHFSQYFSSPLTLNPANTGNFDGPSRLALNFRNQWQGIGNPYITGTASFDTEIFRDKVGKGNRLAVGVMGLYDRTVGGAFTSNYASASVGYHLWTDYDETEKLSIGFQSTLVNKNLDYTKISFADQFASFGFDLSLPSGQTFQSNNINYVDVNAGLMYSKVFDAGSFYVGLSGYHITKPRESFLGNANNRLQTRTTLHGGMNIGLGERSSLMGSAQYMHQGGIRMGIVGLAYGRTLDDKFNDIKVYLGAWYRNKDAIIPYMGYSYYNMQLGLSYDIKQSALNLAGTQNRSFEISLIYTFLDRAESKRYVPWY